MNPPIKAMSKHVERERKEEKKTQLHRQIYKLHFTFAESIKIIMNPSGSHPITNPSILNVQLFPFSFCHVARLNKIDF